jgi:hypothetical protein
MKALRHTWIIIAGVLLAAFSTQDEFIQTLQQKLTAYYQHNIPVKLHLFFNQPEYASGDTAYFKVSFLTAQDHRPVGGHQIIHVNLTDRKGKLIHHQKIAINDGFGFNQLSVPPAIAPGIYTLVAYSEWMKNHDASLFYYHTFIVSGEKKWETETVDNVKFYPEAGNLVAGVPNRVVASGKPNTNFRIFDSRENMVAEVNLNTVGLGTFTFIPAGTEQYTARDDQNRKVVLPAASPDGIAMQVTTPEVKTDPLRIKLQLPEHSALRKEEFYLVASGQGVLYAAAKVTFNENASTVVVIPRNDLPAGMLQITLFQKNGSVVAERLIYSDSPSATVTADLPKKEFNVREKVVLKVKVKDQAGNPIKGKLGATVFNKSLFIENNREQSLQQSLLLLGDLPYGGAENTRHLLEGDATALDNFLITQKWKQFLWEDVWRDVKKREHLFQDNINFTGRIRALNSGEALPDSMKITFFLQRDVTVYETYAKADGRFNFPLLLDFPNKDGVYCRVERKGKIVQDIRIDMDPPEEIAFDLPSFKSGTASDPYGAFSVKRRDIGIAYEFYNRKPSYRKPSVSPHELLEEEIFGPDVTINLDDYLLFPTMEETLREIVPFVMHRMHNGQSVVRIWLDDLDVMASDDPLYIIDGVMTDDTEYFMSLKPENVAVIKVVYTNDKLKTFGAVSKNGIILVETKILDNAKNVPPAKLAFEATGLTPATPFRNKGEKLAPRIPEIRSTLYWNPDITTNDQGEATISFYTADNTGAFTIQLDGITLKGEPVFSEDTFDVKFSKSK